MTVRALPRSLEGLRGRRAARWIRESTAGHADNVGPDAQVERQTRAIERWGLVDTGGAWQVAHSGRTIAASGDPYAEIERLSDLRRRGVLTEEESRRRKRRLLGLGRRRATTRLPRFPQADLAGSR